MRTWYSETNGAQAYDWQLLRQVDIDAGESDWKMTDASTFTQFRENIRIALETVGADGFWMEGNTIIHRDNPIWSTTAFWYGLPAQSANSTPELIQAR